jgi:cytochrome c biogenesis protein
MATVDERPASAAESGGTAATQPAPPPRVHPVIAALRNSWRQLTSMRTALVLLLLLAVAAIPGSVLPQRAVNIDEVNGYFAEHPRMAPVLDRLGAFDVFASPWFAAIYLLLFTSLVGCVVPRLRDHVRALRTAPPAAPRRFDRLPQHAGLADHDGDVQAIAAVLRRRRWRVVVRDDTVSAEKGHLKETGNLLFHFALIGVLVGVALGSWYGWHANRLLVAGPDTAFCNGLQQYDEYGLGYRVDGTDLPRFCMELTDFQASYLDSGQPASFRATARVDGDGAAARQVDFSVNDPLRLDGANVYLLAHGYAPIVRYTDRYGQSQETVAPFLTQDDMLTGEGVAAFPDANVDPATGQREARQQVAFEGIYLPTAPDSAPFVRSVFPAERAPALMLVAYRGDLGLDAGVPSSVYRLDRRQVDAGRLTEVGSKLLRAGEAWTLDDGTTVEFVGTRQWVALSVRDDPGQRIVLGSVALMLAGLMLSLTGKRRRVWFRVGPSPTGGSSTLVEAGGLPRTDYPGFAEEFARLVRDVDTSGKG